MKKMLPLVLALSLIGSSKLLSQVVVNEANPTKIVCGVTAHPLLVVNGFETDMESVSVDPNNIETINVLKNRSAVEKYGEKAKEGVILITTKQGTQFYTISDFVDPSKNLNSSVKKVQLNGKLLPDMKKLLIDKTALPATVVSADGGTVSNCSIAPEGILVINTKFAEKK
jgi:hypothetical protein